jgi:hypothetical protein
MRRALFVAIALAGGCYSPSFNNPTCPTGECPEGLTCVQGMCVQGNGDIDAPMVDTPMTDTPEVDAPMTDGPLIDAATDAAVIDSSIDARIDAAVDAAIDAPIDAPTITHVGSITVAETALLTAGTANTILGQGVVISPNFVTASGNPPVLDTTGGTPNGCKVFTFNDSAEIAASLGLNEGSVQVTVNTNGGQTIPTYPTCTFVPGVGYRCVDPSSTAAITGGGSVTLAPQSGVASMTLGGGSPASFANDDVGRWVQFSGTGSSTVDGREFAILNVPTSTTAIIAIPGFTTAETLATGQFTTVGGYAIQPSLADPGQLADSASVTVAVTGNASGGMNHFGSFSRTIANAGDDFTVLDADANRMRNIPIDGTAFSLSCSSCGTANGMAVQIVTTDTALPPDPYVFPTPTSKSVQIICTGTGVSTINVPANVSAFLQASMTNNARRIRTVLLRAERDLTPPSATTNMAVIVGHSLVGFTSPP